jgi:catechol 2,3-dioxygenase-like lactoylglutathione lyase family enzyme
VVAQPAAIVDAFMTDPNSPAAASAFPLLRPAVQIAYFVTDIRAAAARMHAAVGAGPFFVVDRIELARGEHRGRDCPFVHSSAYGQWGNVMMELVQQDVEGPSPFRDMYAPGAEGLHHVATFVDDVGQAIDHYAAAGLPLAARAWTHSGTEFAFVDATATLGHMIEIYVPTPQLLGFYGFVRDAATGWDGRDPVRVLSGA